MLDFQGKNSSYIHLFFKLLSSVKNAPSYLNTDLSIQSLC